MKTDCHINAQAMRITMRTYHLAILLGSLLACRLQAVGQQAFLANAVRIGNQNGSTMMLAPASGGQFVATFPAASGTVALVGDVSASSSCCARDSTIIMIDHVYAPNNIAPVTSEVIELGGWEHSMTWLVSKDNIAAQDEMAVDRDGGKRRPVDSSRLTLS
ncbi:MAG: hypothetical protein IPF79_08985 [Ignavibacteria bacterium]|nr:hypothetical protein [Ignavibacteria bacterium]